MARVCSMWTFQSSITHVYIVYFSVYYVFSLIKEGICNKEFALCSVHTTPLFNHCTTLKFVYIVNIESCIFVNNCFSKNSSLFSPFL